MVSFTCSWKNEDKSYGFRKRYFQKNTQGSNTFPGTKCLVILGKENKYQNVLNKKIFPSRLSRRHRHQDIIFHLAAQYFSCKLHALSRVITARCGAVLNLFPDVKK